MKLSNPQDYSLTLHEGGGYSIKGASGETKFSSPASSLNTPKLYVIYDSERIHYVGAATRRMSDRLRTGFNANGLHGYHGYKWKNHKSVLGLAVWALKGVPDESAWQELETIEAEIVFLCRLCTEQWPASQHEIHFHISTENHRKMALQIHEHILSLING